MRLQSYILIILGIIFYPLSVNATNPAGDRPTVVVHAEVLVKNEAVILADIAKIADTSSKNEALIKKLKSISIGAAPAPAEVKELQGTEILEMITTSGVSLDEIGYYIPQKVRIIRDGALIEEAEVLDELRKSISQQFLVDGKINIRNVEWQGKQIVPLGTREYAFEFLGRPSQGKLPLRLSVMVDNKRASRFLATALVDHWKEIPVLRRTIERGMLVAADDLELVEVNLSKQPADIIYTGEDLIGRRAKSRLNAGGLVRRNAVDIPPLVSRGELVTIRYNSGVLEATATGRAVEDGLLDDEIRVQNASSRRVLRTRITGAKLVEVIEQ